MQRRAPWQIMLPTVIFVAAALCSIPTFILAAIYLTLGAAAIGHRSLGSFPDLGLSRSWHRGYRVALLHFYHFVWWPWYVREHWMPHAHRFLNWTLLQMHIKRPARDDPGSGADGDGKR
jgi:hypothetical protein